MPVPSATFVPALATFLGLALTYTTVVARKEGNAMDAARTRWQQQRAHFEQALIEHGNSNQQHAH